MSRDKQLQQFKQSPAPSDWVDTLHGEPDAEVINSRLSATDFSRQNLQRGKVSDFALKNKHKGSVDALTTIDHDDRIVLEDPKAELKQSFNKSVRMVRFKTKRFFRTFVRSIRRTLSLLFRLFKTYPKYGIVASLILLSPVALIIIANTSRSTDKKPQTTQVLAETIEKGANRAVYYPSTLPNGYKIISSDGKAINNELVSSYTITNNRANIVVSQQDYMPEQAFKTLFNNAEKIETTLGNAFLILEGENTKLGGLRLSDGRTILLNASYPLDKSTLSLILLSLQPKK